MMSTPKPLHDTSADRSTKDLFSIYIQSTFPLILSPPEFVSSVEMVNSIG